MKKSNSMDDFEQRLKRQSPRQIPGEWRAKILRETNAVAVSRLSSLDSRSSWFSTLNHQLSTLLWPHPKAWAGLAAVWIFIFALNFSMRDKTPTVAEKVSPPSPEMVAQLKQQQLMFAQLLGANDLQPADRQKFLPLPHSEKRFEIMTA